MEGLDVNFLFFRAFMERHKMDVIAADADDVTLVVIMVRTAGEKGFNFFSHLTFGYHLFPPLL